MRGERCIEDGGGEMGGGIWGEMWGIEYTHN